MMGYEVSIKTAKNRFSELVRDAELGQTAVITRNGKPVADLVPHVVRKGGIDFAALVTWEKENGGPLVTFVAPDIDDPLPDDTWSWNRD
jgi:prevent-host-death family protein